MEPDKRGRDSGPAGSNVTEQDVLTQLGGESETQESKHKMQLWTKEDYLRSQREIDQINRDLKAAIEEGHHPGAPQVQRIIRRHYEWMSRYYTPSAMVYIGLGNLYVEQTEHKQLFTAYHPQLPVFLRDGMIIFAERELM
ncbi:MULTISPECIES: TipAS antibiotic-recognition domain-containing protein [Paenibacillus]|uniref:TipAS antibiotic-recognition domain-containing protein n=1 Tax=Paenibacillus TaxID=44249 RepID=UPI000CF87F89|nr:MULTISPECIES: TipAS antibiotic-recognition domain-containing protein [Paenibacillus]MCM3000570.1 TipAS antibiotic-recognition domain-containing protein [Paenibacillus cellulositrophicus]PQP88056.1 hypothetical protein CPT76_21100 [Paenibacillus sp. AR247]